MPGAGHIVHMPAHIYYRVGMYRDSMTLNRKAAQVDENYFKTSPSDPIYKTAYYPHNIHFVLVSAQMGGDGKTAVEAAKKLDASVPMELVKAFPILQPIKSAPFAAHARFSDADTILQLAPPSEDAALVSTMYHYARAVAFISQKDKAGAQKEIDAIESIERTADYKAFEAWGLPAREIIRTAGLVAAARLADANGDLDGAAKLYSDAIKIEDTIPYTEPPYWYYPVRQSLGVGEAAPGQARRGASRRFAIRWSTFATTAGRSPGWRRWSARGATHRPNGRRRGPMSARGSGRAPGRISRGSEVPVSGPIREPRPPTSNALSTR